jgi:hypothetical protein
VEALLESTHVPHIFLLDADSRIPVQRLLDPMLMDRLRSCGRLWRTPRVSIPMAWNFMLMFVETPYALIANSDDAWEPDGIERMLDALEEDRTRTFAFGDYRVEDEIQGSAYCQQVKPFDRERLRRTVDTGPAVMFDAAKLRDDLGGFDTTLQIAADFDAWNKLADLGPGVAVHGEPVLKFRRRAASKSHQNEEARRAEHERVMARYAPA